MAERIPTLAQIDKAQAKADKQRQVVSRLQKELEALRFKVSQAEDEHIRLENKAAGLRGYRFAVLKEREATY